MQLDYQGHPKPRQTPRQFIKSLYERYKLWRLCRKHGITIPHVTVVPGANQEKVIKELQNVFANGISKGNEIKLDEILDYQVKTPTIRPENVPHEDPLMRECIARCFNEGTMIIANRDENGNETIQSYPVKKK